MKIPKYTLHIIYMVDTNTRIFKPLAGLPDGAKMAKSFDLKYFFPILSETGVFNTHIFNKLY